MEDKHIIFLFGALVIVPLGVLIARSNRRVLDFVFLALVFGTTQPATLFGLPTDINFLSLEWYRGSTRGIEVSYLDFLALILFLGSLSVRAREGIRYAKPPSFGLLKANLAWALIVVVLISEPKIYGVFEVTKMARAMLVFLAVWAFMRSPEQVRIFVYVLVLVVFYEATFALYQRYFLGMHRIYASLPHPNSLSMYSLQIFPFMLAVWFAHDVSPRLRKICLLSGVLCAGTVMLTISRTGFAALVVLTFLSLVLNIRGRWTGKNVGIFALIFIVGSAMTFKAWDSLASRYVYFEFQNEYMSEGGDRGSYFRQGWPALQDNPVAGVGLNNWSYWISNRYAREAGYNAEPYPSVDKPPYYSGQLPPAHNLYLLTAVELGWVGFVLLMCLLGRWLFISGVGFRRSDGDLLDRVRLGALLSLCGVLMQSITEWEFRQTSLFFFGYISMSVAAYIYHERRDIYRRRMTV